jgi:hypothetical protein
MPEVRGRLRSRAALPAWGLWLLSVLVLPLLVWFDHLLGAAGRPDLGTLSSDALALVLGTLSATTVGALVAARRPGHPVGWLLLGLGLSVLLSGVTTGYANLGLLARPGSLPGADLVALYPANLSASVAAYLLALVLLGTPTGRPPSPPWRWVAIVAGVATFLVVATGLVLPLDDPYRAAANRLAVGGPLAGPLLAVNEVAFLAGVLAVPVAAASLVVRFRRARGVERQQLRWVALGAALVLMAVLLLAALVAAHASPVALGWASGLLVALLPLATGAAILRYRLYDLDRIISRTLAYGVLTLVLGLGYAAVVLGLGQLVGQASSLLVAAATLAVAAAFQPARRRIQAAVDRRFNRRRYDAARTIAAFSARLRAEVDLATLHDELLAVVDETMQPTAVSLWLRPAQASAARR